MTVSTKQTYNPAHEDTYLTVDKPLAHKIGGDEFSGYVRSVRTAVLATDWAPARYMAAHLPHLAAYYYRGYSSDEAADHLLNEAGARSDEQLLIKSVEVARIIRFALRQRFDAHAPQFFSIRTETDVLTSSIHVRWENGPEPDQVVQIVGVFENRNYDLNKVYCVGHIWLNHNGRRV